MKNKNIYYGLFLLVLIIAVILRIAHVQHADSILIFAFVIGVSIQSWHILQLEKKLVHTSLRASLFNRASSFLVIGAVAMKLMHVPYADIILIVAFLTSTIIKNRYIKELEGKLNAENVPSGRVLPKKV